MSIIIMRTTVALVVSVVLLGVNFMGKTFQSAESELTKFEDLSRSASS